MSLDTGETRGRQGADAPEKRAGFTGLKVDRRTRQSKLAHLTLAAFLEDVGGLAGLTASERLAIEDAALEVARMLEEQATKGQAVASDVAAAAHLARKGRSLVSRIAKRLGARRRLGR
jgi:hypothetical protein